MIKPLHIAAVSGQPKRCETYGPPARPRNMRGAATMSKLKQGYYHLLDAVSGGRVYNPRWMSKLGIPPVPAWTVVWFFDLQNWCRGRR